ncbi:MAG TPA: translational GTPase TypA [Bacilli bacterium]|jgi:GTP-binding protein|nr:translational GTPase TypA [Bacilli bacterium]NLT01074.1 translational GTPase TypA [Acholeplasmataceae bacterium]HNZ77526.1 translational GTPase TypA [Bacilli bacterium]HOD61523.1 translational GTPase TypA [Bacilli bacterium]HOE06371.1 translational GTPase TypA [Bacilli bacterium]
MEIRNVAIIAHVDHGKTTLVDQLLKKSETLESRETIEDRVMDSNDIERERGITILAKNTAVMYKGCKINILDTPGHADFSGEVERIMKMVDGVVLVVDAYEGAMPQTRFVLKEALENNLKPIVVVNKVDKDSARPDEVVDELLDLFIELGANDDQLEFKVVFASATHGTSSLSSDITTQRETMNPILDLIVSEIPAPSVEKDGHLQFQGALLDYNEYVGRMAIGRIKKGTMRTNTMVSCMRLDGSIKSFRIQKLFSFLGLHRTEIEEAYAGDIVAVAGLADINVGETICEVGYEESLPPIRISEPTVEMYFSVNNSPFAGKEGKFVTSTKLEERLYRETQKDVSLRVKKSGYHDEWIVSGRGELHLGILIENMRREGYEFQVAKPKPIIKEIDGKMYEPFEYVQIDIPNEYTGPTIELIGRLGGILESMTNDISQTRLIYTMPSRGLIGVTTDFMTCTKGYGTMSHIFLDYRPLEGGLVGNRKLGVLVATNEGKTTAYGIGQIEDRGVLFIEPNENVYEGQIVGECNKEEDLAVNVVKAKQQTNQRSSSKDMTVVLKRPRIMPLEVCMEYINDDELLEVTPKNIRLRKKILNTSERKKFDSRKER